MRILITGGGGFLGAAAVRALIARGDTAIAFDIQFAQLGDAAPGERLVRVLGDITDMANVAQAVSVHKPDAVVHCAAIVGVLSSWAAPSTSSASMSRVRSTSSRRCGWAGSAAAST
jgi:UDP-glucose 4-epimerase